MNKQQLFIFDVDGVLLDSEQLYLDMNQLFFRELGCNISIEEHHTFIGISATKMWSYIKEKFALPHSVEELKEREKQLKFKTLSESRLTPTSGLISFLDLLKSKNCILTIASSGLRKNIELIISKLNLVDYFDFIVSGEEVINGKPAPDIFLKVAEYYSRKPKNCIVIEDSTNGVKAAKAAGMFCIGYNNPTSGNQDLSAADFITDSFSDIRLTYLPQFL